MDRFAEWIKTEWAEFGFSPKAKPQPAGQDDRLLHPIKVNEVVKNLQQITLGTKEPLADDFFGRCQWGRGPGALEVSFGPFGGVRATIRKWGADLDGEPRWLCKATIEVRHIYDDHPDRLTKKLTEVITAIDEEGTDAPDRDYKKLERFVQRMAGEIKTRTTQKIFRLEGIRQIRKDQHYLILFGVTGAGVQRQDQKRLDQFQIEVKYHHGLIQVTGNEIGDSIKSHSWQIDPSEFNEWFSPRQTQEEIIDAVLANFNCY